MYTSSEAATWRKYPMQPICDLVDETRQTWAGDQRLLARSDRRSRRHLGINESIAHSARLERVDCAFGPARASGLRIRPDRKRGRFAGVDADHP